MSKSVLKKEVLLADVSHEFSSRPKTGLSSFVLQDDRIELDQYIVYLQHITI